MLWEIIVVAALLVAASVAMGLRFVRAAKKLSAPPEGNNSSCGQECSQCTIATPDPPHDCESDG